MEDNSLHTFIETISGDQHFRVQDDLGNGYVRLRAAEAQRRQAQQDIRTFEDVVLELLRNARDAQAQAIFIATWTESNYRHMTILDDGVGIPSNMHETVFEPFVTSKLDTFHSDRWGVHGRGMALYSIKENVKDVHIVASEPGLGSVFSVTSDTNQLGEKRDQSSLPCVVKDAEGASVLKGPHNIARTVMEFALDGRKSRAVYLGSPAEIVATLYHLGASAIAQLSHVFQSYSSKTPYIQRFAFVGDAEELAALAQTYELSISTRTAHRILRNEIEPLRPHAAALQVLTEPANHSLRSHASGAKANSNHKSQSRSTSIKFDAQDLKRFSQEVRQAYSALAQAYYLTEEVEPSISTRGSELVIRIPLEKDQ